MYFELTKKDKKIVRALLDKGQAEDFRRGMEKFEKIMQQWRNASTDHQGHYYKIYEAVQRFDKHIARRYDGLGGSRWLATLAAQIADGLVDASELDALNPDAKTFALMMAGKIEL